MAIGIHWADVWADVWQAVWEDVEVDPASAIDVIAALQDLTVVVPEIAQDYVSVAYVDTLVDETGAVLVDETGEVLIATRVELEHVYVVHAASQDLTVVIPEEA